MAEIKTGKKLAGFKITSVRKIVEYDALLYQAVHQKSGLEVVHICNNDPENLFAFIFRTPVDNNTGVPHILEHSTLCGSRRFPLKDPFVILLKGSMQTFLNAYTGQDCTVYLASSTLEEDFYNLLQVYGDAVFFPLLKEEVFLQEGFHYERDDNGQLRPQGVVYNEMQGNYSSPDSIVYDWSIRSLFPDSTYGYDCGGDPQHIPELTYTRFLAFHREYYHPSNGKLFLYGNLSFARHLAFLDENFLNGYTREKQNSAIQQQSRWASPRLVKKSYPSKQGLDLSRQSFVTLNWLTTSVKDPFEMLKLELLSEILLGNAGSPLRKALVESRLGEDLSPASGLDTNLQELVFSAGLRGTGTEQVDAIINCIFQILKEIQDKGLEPQIIQAALHRLEFRKRELSSGSPYGIKLLFKVIRGWLHDFSPWHTLEYAGQLARLKKYIARNKKFYTSLIDDYLIKNTHRTTLVVYPDPEQEKREKDTLNNKLGKLAEDESKIAEILKKQKQLIEFQQLEDSPEDLARIPSLKLSDLPPKVTAINFEKIPLAGDSVLYYHDIRTHDIVYLDFAFNIDYIRGPDRDYLPLLGKVLLGCGLPGLSYAQVANQISLYTGGITAGVTADTSLSGQEKLYLVLSLKFLKEKFAPALELFFNLLLNADFSDRERIKDLIVEMRNKYKSSLIPNGNYFTSLRAAAKLSELLKIEEQWHGIEQYLFLEKLANELDTRLDETLGCFKRLQQQIFKRENVLVNLCCDDKNFPVFRKKLFHCLKEELPGGGTGTAGQDKETFTYNLDQEGPDVESLVTSSQINFVAHAFPGARIGTPENAVESVLSHLLSTGYLWEKVRVQGGAYGVSASSYSQQGIYAFSSFRDPQINATLKAYRESLSYIKEGRFSAEQLKLAIIGTIAKHEKPLRGARKGYINFKRQICGITDRIRQNQRDKILSLDKETLSQNAARLLDNFEAGATVLITNKTALNEAGQTNPLLPGVLTDLPL